MFRTESSVLIGIGVGVVIRKFLFKSTLTSNNNFRFESPIFTVFMIVVSHQNISANIICKCCHFKFDKQSHFEARNKGKLIFVNFDSVSSGDTTKMKFDLHFLLKCLNVTK